MVRFLSLDGLKKVNFDLAVFSHYESIQNSDMFKLEIQALPSYIGAQNQAFLRP